MVQRGLRLRWDSALGQLGPASSNTLLGGGTLLVLLPGAGPQRWVVPVSHTSSQATLTFDCSGCHATASHFG